MIIPIKCVTCGFVLADKYRYYLSQVRSNKLAKGLQIDSVLYLNSKNTEKTVEGEVLDQMRIKNVCCRRHMLTHVDMDV
jgi:DNA-directed RNA polymerase I, II, and III subunit RPABC5